MNSNIEAKTEPNNGKSLQIKGGIEEATDVSLTRVSKMYDIDGDGKLNEAEMAMRNMDTSGRGYLSNEKVYGLMQEHLNMQKELFKFKKIIIGLVGFTVLLTLCNLGTSFAAASLAKETTTNSNNQLVKPGSDEAISTQTTAEIYGIERVQETLTEEDGRGLVRIDVSSYYQFGNSRGNSMISNCYQGNIVKVKRHWDHDGSTSLTKICPENGDYTPDDDGWSKLVLDNGVIIKKIDGSNKFRIDGDFLTQDEGEKCDVDHDCDSGLKCDSNSHECRYAYLGEECYGDEIMCNSDYFCDGGVCVGQPTSTPSLSSLPTFSVEPSTNPSYMPSLSPSSNPTSRPSLSLAPTSVHSSVIIVPSDIQEYSRFGQAITFIGNDKMAVGAPNSGRVYIYTLWGNEWLYEFKLTPDDGRESTYFGGSVDYANDMLLIGDQFDRSVSVRTLTGDGAGWCEEHKLVSDVNAVSFGASVKISGNTAAIGAPEDAAVFVFEFDGSEWSQKSMLEFENSQPGDLIGLHNSIAIDEDTIIVGNVYEDGALDNIGAAHVFVRDSDGDWTQEALLTAPEDFQQSYHFFGQSVAIHGDVALVGATSDDSLGSQVNGGAVYVYTRSNSIWSYDSKLIPEVGTIFLGMSISFDGDTAVVGGYIDDGSNLIAMYVFDWDGSSFVQRTVLVAPDGQDQSLVDVDVAFNGDVAMAGAPLTDDVGVDSGVVYAFDLSPADR